MRLACAPECLTLPTPPLETREPYAYPPAKRGSRVLEHTPQMWHATPMSPDSSMRTSTLEDAPNVLEHNAHVWHNTPDAPNGPVLEHTSDAAKSLNFNGLRKNPSIPPLEVPTWHATLEDTWDSMWTSTQADAPDVLEHAADVWHATIIREHQARLEYTLCACKRRCFCVQ